MIGHLQNNTTEFKFTDSKCSYQYYEAPPAKTINLKIKQDERAYRINIAALHLYGLYRNTVYSSYSKSLRLASDIKQHPPMYHESNTLHDPIYHYAIRACVGAMQEWLDPNEKMHAYFAYEIQNDKKRLVGFVQFQEKLLDEKKVIYIAQAGVEKPGQGIGKELMHCVMSHYKADTEFYILTRDSNDPAKFLYKDKLDFAPIEEKEIRELGYDSRYCGFHRISTQQEINDINNNKVIVDTQSLAYLQRKCK